MTKPQNLDKVLSTLTCPICIDVFAAPFILSCGHSFCCTCLRSSFEKMVSCPSCRTPVTSLPIRNLVLNEIVTNCASFNPNSSDLLKRLETEFKRSKQEDIWKPLLSKLPKIALEDTSDDVFRCSECNWEVVNNTCVNCHAFFDGDGMYRGYLGMEDESQFDSDDSIVFVNDFEEDPHEMDGFIVHTDDEEIEGEDDNNDYLLDANDCEVYSEFSEDSFQPTSFCELVEIAGGAMANDDNSEDYDISFHHDNESSTLTNRIVELNESDDEEQNEILIAKANSSKMVLDSDSENGEQKSNENSIPSIASSSNSSSLPVNYKSCSSQKSNQQALRNNDNSHNKKQTKQNNKKRKRNEETRDINETSNDQCGADVISASTELNEEEQSEKVNIHPKSSDQQGSKKKKRRKNKNNKGKEIIGLSQGDIRPIHPDSRMTNENPDASSSKNPITDSGNTKEDEPKPSQPAQEQQGNKDTDDHTQPQEQANVTMKKKRKNRNRNKNKKNQQLLDSSEQ